MAPDPAPDPSSDVPPEVAGVARDASSMTAILQTLAREGFPGELEPAGRDRPGAIRCAACGEVSDASLFTVDHLRRMEGASDPDEMMIIAALRCPVCDSGGSLVLSYGPEVTETDSEILVRLPAPPPPPVVPAPDSDHRR